MGKYNKKLNIILISVLFCLILLIFGARKILNYDFFEKTFFNITNLKLELINPKTTMGLNLSVKFKADKINIFNKEKTVNFICIDNIDTVFRPIGFLFNKINVKKADMKNININLSLNDNNEIDLISSINKDFLNKIKKTKPTYNLLNFKAENLVLNYNSKDFKTNLLLDNTNLNISKSKHQFNFSTKGNINTKAEKNLEKASVAIDIASKYPFEKNNKEDLKTDVEIKNINLLTFNDLAKTYISKDIKEFQGNVDIYLKTQDENQKANINIKNHKIVLKDKTITPYKETINISSLFNFNKDKLFLKDLVLKANELDVEVSGEIDKLSSKTPKINLSSNIKNTQLNHFVYYFPDNLIFYRPSGIPTLKNSNFYGVIDGNIDIKTDPTDARGNIKVSNVHIPKIEKPYRQNDVYITLLGDRMRVYSKVYTPQNEFVIIDGISILDKSMQGSYNVTSSKNIDLVFAKKYLIPIQQIIGFNIGPVPNMDITGFGNINIKTKGSLFNPQVFGEFNATGATASIKNINTVLTKGNCKLVFDNKTVYLKDVRGKINNADFILKGNGNTKGELKLEALIKNISLNNLIEIFNGTIITKEFSNITKNISATSGKADVDLTLEGVVPDNNYEDSEFFKYLNPSGNLTFKNNKISLKNQSKIEKLKGTVNFGKEQKAVLESYLGGSKFNIILNSKTSIEKILKDRNIAFSANIVSSRFNSVDIYNQIKNLAPFNKYLKQININEDYIRFFAKANLDISGKINIDNYSLQNPTINGYLTGLNDKNSSAFVFNGGNVKFSGKKALLDKINIHLPYGEIKINGDINNPISAEPNFNIKANLDDINLSKLNTFFPKIKFKQSYLKNGEIVLKNHDIKFNNINISYEEMPLFLNAQIKNIFKNTSIQTNFSTIINENTTDSLINPYLVSPLKIKGEIPIKGFIKGTNENYSVSFKTKIPKNSDISFMGANIGDVSYNRQLDGNIEVSKDVAKINEIKLIKFITNQNNKTNPLTMLKIDGKIKQIKDDIFYDNLKVTTSSPMNVRMLNLIFKKSLLKKGVFDCNIALNGNSKAPKIIGRAYFSDLDIPLYSTKVDSIDFDMTKNIMSGKIIAKSKENDVNISFKAPNNIITPFTIEELNIESNKLNINSLLNSITQQAPKSDIALKQDIIIKPQDIIISKGTVDLKEIQYDKIEAKNLKTNFNFKDNILTLEDIIFDIAQGQIVADGKYNLSSTKLNLKAAIKECNSNLLVYQFLHLSDQIFGKMNGNIELTGSNLNTPQNIKNINSKITFSIENGKMTKLGSLEYLLRAGNIIKNGLLSLSLNNLIQILTPYKTGEFENIKGNLLISKGCVKNLEIMTKGKNMSLLIEGNYDILKNFADANIYGKLSQNVSNSLGMFGNASIKQILDSITMNKIKSENNLEIINKIPSIENENPTPRYFKARVLGDINKENYIKSFNWEIK